MLAALLRLGDQKAASEAAEGADSQGDAASGGFGQGIDLTAAVAQASIAAKQKADRLKKEKEDREKRGDRRDRRGDRSRSRDRRRGSRSRRRRRSASMRSPIGNRGARAHSAPRRPRSREADAGPAGGRSNRRASSQASLLGVIPEKSLDEEPLKQGGVLGPVASRSGAGSGWVSVLHDSTRRSFVSYRPNPFTKEQLHRWFKAVRANLNWDRPEVNGRKLPRSACWLTAEGCSCTYRYSGTAWPSVEMSPWFIELTDAVCKVCGLNELPNSCNANLYEDGSESVGWHADDEPWFDAKHRDALIISLSLGAARNFLVRPLSDQKDQTTLRLDNGDLCTMEGMMQKHYQHAVLPEPNCRSVRINLTWRWVVKHDSQCIKRNTQAKAKGASLRSLPSEVAHQIAAQAEAAATKSAQAGLAAHRSSNSGSAVAEASERADSRSHISGKRRRSEEASRADPPMPPPAPRDRRGDGGMRRDHREEEEDIVDRAENSGEGTRSWTQRRKPAAPEDSSEAQQRPPSPTRRWKERPTLPSPPGTRGAAEEDASNSRGGHRHPVEEDAAPQGKEAAGLSSQRRLGPGDDSTGLPEEPPTRSRGSRGSHAERPLSALPAPSKAPHLDCEDDRRGRKEVRKEEPECEPGESKTSQQDDEEVDRDDFLRRGDRSRQNDRPTERRPSPSPAQRPPDRLARAKGEGQDDRRRPKHEEERPHRDHHLDRGEGQRSSRRGTEMHESGRDGGTDNQDLRNDRKQDSLPPNAVSGSRADQRRARPLPTPTTEEAAGSRGEERGSRGSQHDPPVRSRSLDDERCDASARRHDEGAEPSSSSRLRNDSRQPERQFREFVEAQRSRRGGDGSDRRERENGAGLDAEPACSPEQDGAGERSRTKPQRQSGRRPEERTEREALPERSSGGRRGDAPSTAPPSSRQGQRAPREPEDEGGREDREERRRRTEEDGGREERRGEHMDRRSERHEERSDFRDDRYARDHADDKMVRGHDRENAPGAGDFDPRDDRAAPPHTSGSARSSDRRRRQEANETPAAQSSRASGEQGRTWVRNRPSDREERVEDESASSKKPASNVESQRKSHKNTADSRNTRTPTESAQPSSGGGSSSRVTLKESAAARSRRIDEQAGDYSRSGRDSRDPGRQQESQRSWHNRQGDEDNAPTSREVKLSRKEETRGREDHPKESARQKLILKPAKEQSDRDRARR